MYDAKKLLNGDENELTAAVDELSPKLMSYACGVTLNSADAADAIQEAFIRMWRARTKLRDPDAFESFMYRSVYHACIDIIRRRRLFVVPEVQNADTAFVSAEMRAALDKLPPKDRLIVYSRAVEEREYSELARLTGMKESAVRKRYERAKKKLASLYLACSETVHNEQNECEGIK